MIKQKLRINNIPAILWGDKSEKLFIAVHGNMSDKEDQVIHILAEEVIKRGYGVLSFDLPQHGKRKCENYLCNVQNCVKDLNIIMDYARGVSNNISLFACSIGSYFSLVAYSDKFLNQSLFISPVVDMQRIINNMMTYFKVSEERLEKEKQISTPIGQTLYWDYYCYVKEHPIVVWNSKTSIIYGSRDNLCEFDVISEFVKRFNCDLSVMDNAEHYFHTEEQLKFFRQWLKKCIK